MYSKTYYPTPIEVIERMIEPYKEGIKKMNILEPSAGMGAILDYLSGYRVMVPKTRLFACEIDLHMKATLIGKQYKVVQEDFLNYSGSLDFNLIIMNPPFDAGVHHLLKAWDILREGDIVCLLNAETIRNPNSVSKLQLQVLIEQHGSVEFLGPVFQSADRKTNVDVAMVRLKKITAKSAIAFEGIATEKPGEINLESDTTEVERRDYIDAITRAYDKAVASTAAMYTALTEFQLFAGAFCSQYDTPKLLVEFFNTARKEGYSAAHNEFVMAFQRHAWNLVFNNTRASALMTGKVKEKFNAWREEMGGMDLNETNILMLFETLLSQRKNIADECIVEAFDRITGVAKSNLLQDKWKTNSAYMVPEKFILPWVVENSRYGGGLSMYYKAHDYLDDIDRALCLISGKPFDEISKTGEAIRNWCRDKFNPEESEFFTFKCHLKGTVHFKFKDLKLLELFNRRACEAKGFTLPSEEKFRGKDRRSQKVK